MQLTTTQQVANWIHASGGLARGLPRLRRRIRSGLLSATEVDVVKDYLADLDEEALKAATLPAARGNTAVVIAVMAAALAAMVMVARQ